MSDLLELISFSNMVSMVYM